MTAGSATPSHPALPQPAGRGGRVAIQIFALRCAAAGVAYLMQVGLARLLGDAEYGVFVTAWTLVPLVGTLACLGLPLAAQKLIPLYLAANDRAAFGAFLRGARQVAGLTGVALAGLGIAGLLALPHVPLVQGLADSPYRGAILVALLTAPIFAVGAVQEGIARSFDWTATAMLPSYLLRPLLLMMLGGAAIWLGQPALAVTAMLAGLVATALTVAGQRRAIAAGLDQAGLARAADAPVPRLRDWIANRKTWLGLGTPILIVEVCDLVMLNADVLMLAAFASPQEVGIYFAAAKTLMLVQFVYFAVATAMSHRFAAHHAAGDEAGLRAALRRAVHWTFWPSLAATALMLAAGPYLLALFGPAFVAAWPVMAILSLGLLLRAGVGPLERLLNMIGHEWAAARAYGIAAAACIVLNLALIPAYGIRGAAAAMAATYAIETLLLVVAARAALPRRLA